MHRPMLKPHASQFALVLRASDPVIAILVGLVAYLAYLRALPLPENYTLFIMAAALAIVAIFPLFRLYEAQRGASVAEELQRLLFAWASVGALAGVTIFATKSGNAFSRVWFTSWLLGSFASSAAARIVVRVSLRALRRRGYNLRHIVIVGAGDLGREIAERLSEAAWTGLNVVGFYDDDPAKTGAIIDGRPVLGTTEHIAVDLIPNGVDQVWIALPLRAEARIRDILTALRDAPVEVRFVPDIYSFHLLNHSLTEVAGLPVISLTETPIAGVNRVIKTLEDLAFGLLALFLAAPAIIAIAIAVKLTSPGPVLYRQQRMTWNGQCFDMLKFRTMHVDAEALGPIWSGEASEHLTPLGAVLRRLSLDELPQLLNVIKGDMSLVGPRPERPEFVEQFRQEIPGYMQKHLVKAGMTGWAQVNDLRGNTDIPRRIQYDLYYIDHWSLWFDLRILAMTLWHILQSRNAR